MRLIKGKTTRLLLVALLVASLAVSLAGCGTGQTANNAAAKEIKIGVIYPMTGPDAVTGVDLMNGVNLAADIINGQYPNLNLPLAATAGLPNLGGAKIVIVPGDSQSSPEKGMSEAERLITQEKVAALMGCYESNVTATASQVAERDGIPFLNGTSTSPSLITRGYKWFFRTTPDDHMFAGNFFQFLDQLKQNGTIKNPKLAIVHENTLWGTDVAKAEEALAQKDGYTVATDVAYPAKSTNVTSEVEKIKESGANIVLQASYASDAVLFMQTYKNLNYNPQAILGMDAGFVDAGFLKALGPDGYDILSREVWALDLAKAKPMVATVNGMFKQKYGHDMNGNTARAFTALFVLADAVNRAASTDPAAIQKALLATDIPGDQLVMPWQGVKFDPADHQNTLGSGIIVQVQNGKYVTVWPSNQASEKIIWPFPAWNARH